MPRFAIMLLSLSLAFAAPLSGHAQQGPGDESVVSIADDDPAMVDAIETARGHLGQVLTAAINEFGVAHPGLTLKVAFPVESAQMDREVIWLSDISLAQDGMAGRLANDPVAMPGLKFGDEVRFTQDMIYDWGLAGPDDRIFGHFTTRVLLDQIPKAQADEIRTMLSDDPLPEAWR
ncbi:MAG TPA: DUF2314 domain-containing protein [Rhodobacterales bacterium]|nr:DUF2314 domain-containing protein [Rhodobacterales bacterium]